MNTNLKLEKRILNISLMGSIAFLLAEVIMAIITASNAVFMDCIFDIADLIMIGPFMVLVPLLYRPVTEQKPYGFSQVESLFVLIKCLILIGVTIFLIVSSVQTILEGGNEVDAGIIAIFEIAVSVTCVIMYITLSKLNKKYSSPSIKAELYIWKLDALSTMGVGLAFLIKLVLDHTSLAFVGPYVDPGIAIILAAILLKEPVALLVEAMKNLMLFSADDETTDEIRTACEEELSKCGYYINFLDIIKTGRKIWVSVYVVRGDDHISISELKDLHSRIVEKLKPKYDSFFIELIPDMEDIRKENLKKIEAERRPDKINYMNEKERKHQDKKEKKTRNING